MMTVNQIINEFNKNRAYYQKGGITVTGGEPLLQIEFVTNLFQAAKAQGIHTCLDTSGVTFRQTEDSISRFDRLLKYLDLVLLDIKHIKKEAHQELTGASNQGILAFAQYLDQHQIPVWVRHVLLPGYTDQTADLEELGFFLGGLTNIEALEILPYHTMGIEKYQSLDIHYPLAKIKEPDREAISSAKQKILHGFRRRRIQDQQMIRQKGNG